MSEKWSWWPDCCRDGGMITDDATAVHIAAPTYYAAATEMTAKHARLLASAPELLAALEDMVAILPPERRNGGSYENAKRAIAKATAKGEMRREYA